MSLGVYILSSSTRSQLRLVWKDKRQLVSTCGEFNNVFKRYRLNGFSFCKSNCQDVAGGRKGGIRETVSGCSFTWCSLTEGTRGRSRRFYSIRRGSQLCHSTQNRHVKSEFNRHSHSCSQPTGAANTVAGKSGIAVGASLPSDTSYEAGYKASWIRLYTIGGVGLFVGWHAERLWEDACGHYNPESVLCVNIIDGEMAAVKEQLPVQTPAVVNSALVTDRSCNAYSKTTLDSTSDSTSSRCTIRTVTSPVNSDSTQTRPNCSHSCNSSNTSGTPAPHHTSSAVVEDEIFRWQGSATSLPGFISSRVYVQVDPRPLTRHQARAATSDIEWPAVLRAENRRYLLLDRWASRQDAEANYVAEQNSGNNCSSRKKRQQFNVRSGILGDCQGTLYSFDSRQAAPLWGLFLFDAVGEIFSKRQSSDRAETCK